MKKLALTNYRIKNNKICFFLSCLIIFGVSSCTNLDEEVFSLLVDENYFSDKASVEAAALCPYEFAHSCAWHEDRWILQELTADQFVWTQKGKHGWDDGMYVRLHRHNWDYLQKQINGGWVAPFQGVAEVNHVLANFETLNFEKLGITTEEKNNYIAEMRVLRAWFYIWLIDFFRYVPISIDTKTISGQSPPQEVFEFMEKELKEAIPGLNRESSIGRICQSAAAGLLVRIYLNAEMWTGVDKSEECIRVAEDIIAGKYGGDFSIDTDYRGPFKSFFRGRISPENLWEWPHQHRVFQLDFMFEAFHHYKINATADTDGYNGYNGIHLSPSKDLEGNIYNYALGKPFEKYADGDYRKQNYEVIDSKGNSNGFFLIGPQYEFNHTIGYGYNFSKPVTGSEEWTGQQLVYVDQVGRFSEKPGGRWNEGSQVTSGEENSGVRLMKFGPYSHTCGLFMNNSIAEVRLAEIYYSLAECKYKAGKKAEAAKLLDAVRKRNYPDEIWAKYSYEADVSRLTDQEFIDEWGREFLGEHRRRTDLIRWGRFGEAWWDKEIDRTDKDYEIFPIPSRILNSNPLYKQTTKGWE